MKRPCVSVLILMFMMLSTLLSINTPRTWATISLVGYWKFDEGSGGNASDSSGNGNNGVIFNAAWVDGKVGKALSFDGVDDYVKVPMTNSLSVTHQVTLEAWVCPRRYVDSQGEESHIISSSDPANGYHLLVLWLETNGQVGFQAERGQYYVNADRYKLSATTLPLDTWTHLALTFDGSVLSLYVNGALDCTLPQSVPITTTSNWLGIGCKPTGPYGGSEPAAYFNGILDEVKIYNYARVAYEIKSEYASVANEGVPPSALSYPTALIISAAVIALAGTSAGAFLRARKMKKVKKEKQRIREEVHEAEAEQKETEDEKRKAEEEMYKTQTASNLNELFDVLGVPYNATGEMVKDAYRQLSKKWHPDMFKGSDERVKELANEKFCRINAAYEAILRAKGWSK